ncbi:hypothetical protein P4S54_14850 [Shewanella sp. PP-He15 brown]
MSELFKNYPNHEELLVIAELINELKLSAEVNMSTIIHNFEKSVIDYWADEIHEEINENIEHCEFESIKTEANKYIKSLLSQYDLELEELSDQLVDCVNVDEIYTGIMERYSYVHCDYSNNHNKESSDSFDEVDDLFDRTMT